MDKNEISEIIIDNTPAKMQIWITNNNGDEYFAKINGDYEALEYLESILKGENDGRI